MRWSSGLGRNLDLVRGLEEAASAAVEGLGGAAPDLAVVFISPTLAGDDGHLAAALKSHLGDCTWFGCTAAGVIGGGHEVEQEPSVSVTVATLPDVRVHPFHLEEHQIPPPLAGDEAWHALFGVSPDEDPQFLLIGDPFSFNVERLLGGMDRVYPQSGKAGGLASGSEEPGQSTLYACGRRFPSGICGVALTGNVHMDTLVSQGCRPIGEPMFVTSAERNMLRGLDGNLAIEALKSLYERVEARDQDLMQHSLFLGIAVSGEASGYGHGDFLIRNVLGADQGSGSIAIGALLETNSIVQFHVRDAEASAEDLEQLLRKISGETPVGSPAGSLLFSCLGRGKHLYGEPDHDSNALRRHLGPIPLGGFFCNGEIGPIHGSTFLHGYTSAFALFRAKSP